tara:strand:- start:65 stop:271 length:207 start_codon:yes stop_codon:yes gene_type:complete
MTTTHDDVERTVKLTEHEIDRIMCQLIERRGKCLDEAAKHAPKSWGYEFNMGSVKWYDSVIARLDAAK